MNHEALEVAQSREPQVIVQANNNEIDQAWRAYADSPQARKRREELKRNN
jgi:hypothetical protein